MPVVTLVWITSVDGKGSAVPANARPAPAVQWASFPRVHHWQFSGRDTQNVYLKK